MTLDNPLAIDRQTLLASIPDEWEAKFKEEFSRSPILKLVQKAVPNAPATSPELFANGISSNFATCKLLWESVNILTQRSDLLWQPDEDGKLTYTSTLKDGRGRLIFWVTDRPEEQYPEALAGEAALAVIETFDIRAACMHLTYAAHVTTLDRTWEEECVIDDAQISSYLGLDKRKDLTKEQRLKRAHPTVGKLQVG